MKKVVVACFLMLSSVARADDPGMQLMQTMMQCPAISSDGKHIAVYSEDPGKEKDAKTSLAVFSPSGKLEQRISVVPPNTDVKKAQDASDKITKLLADGGYKRMSRVKSVGDESSSEAGFSAQLETEDVKLDVKLEKRTLTIAGTRGDKKLKTVTRKLPAKDGPCTAVSSFSLTNTTAGYDAKKQVFAFSVSVENAGTVCFAHNFVVPLK